MLLEPVTILISLLMWLLVKLLYCSGLTDCGRLEDCVIPESLQVALLRRWKEVGEEQCIPYMTCMLSLPLRTQIHRKSWMNKHACPHHPTLCKVHYKKRRTYKEQECYIFITDLINTKCPKLFRGVPITQQKGLQVNYSMNPQRHWDSGKKTQ